MNIKSRLSLLPGLATAAVFATLMTGPALHAQTLSNIAPSGAYQFSQPTAINDAGVIVGANVDAFGNISTYEYSSSGGMTAINLGISTAVPTSINNSGQITGIYTLSNGNESSFYYSQGVFSQINGLNAGLISTAGSFPVINNSGVVVGSAANAQTAGTFFTYQNGVVTDVPAANSSVFGLLSEPGFPANFSASGINDAGSVALYDSEVQNPVALVYNIYTKTLTTIGSLGGSEIETSAINASGEVTGFGNPVGDATLDGFVWANGILKDIGTLGGSGSNPAAINNAGVVVGVSNLADGDETAFIYSSNLGKMTALDTLYANLLVAGGSGSPDGFVSLDSANGINNSGEILGEGTYWNGTSDVQEGFVLADDTLAVPEPGTWALLVGGCGALVFFRRVRSKRCFISWACPSRSR